MTGIELIALERLRQVTEEGVTVESDVKRNADNQLVVAAVLYADRAFKGRMGKAPLDWPWAAASWKPSDDPIRNLVKAGALIAAEIDRLNSLRPSGFQQ